MCTRRNDSVDFKASCALQVPLCLEKMKKQFVEGLACESFFKKKEISPTFSGYHPGWGCSEALKTFFTPDMTMQVAGAPYD